MIISLRHTFGLGLLLLAGAAQAQTAAFGLHAASGNTLLPDGLTSPVLGYAQESAPPVTTPPITAPGGPVLVVNQGDLVTVTLHNDLTEPTALLFQGQAMVPDTAGVAAGGTRDYSFTASSPGTFLYEAGPIANAQHQVARGLYGALVVRPVFATPPLQPQAYASDTTAYDDEAVLVLSELDPALNSSAAPATFDMRDFAPRYFLINGKAYPATAPILTAAGRKVLLRYVNAGIRHHSMTLLGVQQDLVAKDGSPTTYTGRRVAETIAPGQTMDAVATIPAGATGQFALMDGNLNLFNNKAPGLGGMLTFLSAGGTPPAAGPSVTALSVSPGLTALAATITASAGKNVTAAEYWIDGGTHTPVDLFTAAASVAVAATLPPQGTGNHTIYVRGQDGTPTWGAARSLTFSVDTTGPAITGLGVAPSPTNGSANVAVTATGDDRATGNANVTAAEYFIDAATPPLVTIRGTPMTINVTAPVASLTATIPAGTVNALWAGAHVVSARSQDALGNWGGLATTNLVVDKTGPTASNLIASPNPTNGKIGFNSNTPAVHITATLADAASGIAAGEGFIDTVGASGTGFPFIPADGQFSSLSEAAYADVPLTTINALSAGSHTIYVHGKDAAGNWGATTSISLVVDKTLPTISGVTLTPSTVAVGTASTLAVAAADTGTGVSGGQYWIDGTATPPANPTSFTGTAASIATGNLTGAVHTVYVRVRDAAGNWSAVSSAQLTVIKAVDDARSITANNNATQTSDANAAAGVLTNDMPIGLAGRTARLATAPVRTSGAGTGTITVTCQGGTGNVAATPAIGGNTLCTNGAYRVTLNGVGATGAARRTSKVGTYQFTYSEIVNSVSSTATVTITVN